MRYFIMTFVLWSYVSGILMSEVSTNNWYVGNTKPGEWVQFNKVWLSSGNYRFTTNAVAQGQGQTVHLELNGQILENNVLIPVNNADTFELVHLGHQYMEEGYYDVRLVFETGNVNCDMVFIRKSNHTTTGTLPDDTYFTINRTDGPHIAAIGGAINASSMLAKGSDPGDNGSWRDVNGNLYSREQMLLWHKQEMYAYTPEGSDRAMDYYVSEQVEAKVDFIYAHGRGDIDFVNDVEDRAYQQSVGGFGCKLLKKLVEAIERNKYAKDNLKIAFFSDNAVYPLIYRNKYPEEVFAWDNPKAQECIWTHVVKPFFDHVPRKYLYEKEPGIVPYQLWTSNANLDYGNTPKGERKIMEFLVYISDKMYETYGFRPGWILAEDFFQNDTRLNTYDKVAGIQAWFTWGGDITSMRTCPVNGEKFAFALNGGRHPIANRWLNDWNPASNTGTQSTHRETDYHQSALDSEENPVIRPIFERAIRENAQWVVLESWSDWSEGSTWYRSNHPEYRFPNQHIALVREFADQNSESILLEVEGCDEYYSRSEGNRGGAYRVNWYNQLDKDFWDSDKEVDMDVYRPLHKIGEWKYQGKPSSSDMIIDFTAGNKDIWGFTKDGTMYAHQIDGSPAENWSAPITSAKVKKLSMGGQFVWAIDKNSSNKIIRAEIPRGETYEHRGWTDKTSGMIVQDVAASLKEAWGVSASNRIYYRDLDGKREWTRVPGELKSIIAEDQCVWGFTPQDSLVRMSSEKKNRWDTIPNPHRLLKISGNSGEIWGVNALNQIYRINSSGDGHWQWIAEGCRNVAVGMEYVWIQDVSGNFYNARISGFENGTAFANQTSSSSDNNTPIANIQDIHAYPTRFVDYICMDITTGSPSEATALLLNSNGQVIRSQQHRLSQGVNKLVIHHLQDLPQGLYILSVIGKDGTESFKMTKTN